MIEPSHLHLKKRAIAVRELPISNHSRYVVDFADGSSVSAALVIGADGIKSVIRSFVAGSKEGNHLLYYGTDTYRGIVDIQTLKKSGVTVNIDQPTIWVGLNKVLAILLNKGYL